MCGHLGESIVGVPHEVWGPCLHTSWQLLLQGLLLQLTAPPSKHLTKLSLVRIWETQILKRWHRGASKQNQKGCPQKDMSECLQNPQGSQPLPGIQAPWPASPVRLPAS